jgi:hypothetical protein
MAGGKFGSQQQAVRSAVVERRAEIEGRPALKKMAALLDEWSKWARDGGGLGLGCAKHVSAERHAAAMYCISDDEAVLIERSLALLEKHHRRYWEVVHRRHWDQFSFYVISTVTRRPESTVRADYRSGLEHIKTFFDNLQNLS